jgi:hypothetical protein|nr:MAG TPA: Helicase ATPase REPLICATION [Crassvirales sp.]
MSIVNRVVDNLQKRRENILNGNVNCIPSPFNTFRNNFVGIEQGKYYLVSAHQKSGKTQITSYLFIYAPILYAYKHREQIKLKIFYYPLEESKEEIVLRFMSFLLYTLSSHTIRIAPIDLKSTDENKVLDKSILDILRSEEYQDILKFFEECVDFREATNPTGVWKDLNEYAKNHGTVHTNKVTYKDRETGEERTKEVFDYYTPNDPNEYVMIIWDHVSLTSLERGLDLRQTIMKLSEYMVNLRNMYSYIPVVIQQQSDETQNLDAFKANKIRPNVSGLADCKYTARDCNMMLGLINPYAFEIPKYLNYDIVKFEDHIRFLEVVLNRNGNSKGVKPLYFDGAVSFFAELPKHDDVKSLNKVYEFIRNNNPETSISLFAYTCNHKNKK